MGGLGLFGLSDCSLFSILMLWLGRLRFYLCLVMTMSDNVVYIYVYYLFSQDGVMKGVSITQGLSLCTHWIDGYQVRCHENVYVLENISQWVGYGALLQRKIMGLGSWGNDRLNPLKKILVKHGSSSWSCLNVISFLYYT